MSAISQNVVPIFGDQTFQYGTYLWVPVNHKYLNSGVSLPKGAVEAYTFATVGDFNAFYSQLKTYWNNPDNKTPEGIAKFARTILFMRNEALQEYITTNGPNAPIRNVTITNLRADVFAKEIDRLSAKIQSLTVREEALDSKLHILNLKCQDITKRKDTHKQNLAKLNAKEAELNAKEAELKAYKAAEIEKRDAEIAKRDAALKRKQEIQARLDAIQKEKELKKANSNAVK